MSCSLYFLFLYLIKRYRSAMSSWIVYWDQKLYFHPNEGRTLISLFLSLQTKFSLSRGIT